MPFLVDGGYISWIYGTKPGSWASARGKYSTAAGALLVLDSPVSFRSQFWAGYKSNRAERRKDDPEKERMYQRVKALIRDVFMEDPSLTIAQMEGLEADDLVAMVVNHQLMDPPVALVGVDKDLLQLDWEVFRMHRTDGEGVGIHNYRRKLPLCIQPYINRPIDILMALVLLGDSSDNIPRLVPAGQLKQAINIWRSTLPWEEAYHMYGEDLLRNLYLAVLPGPWCYNPVPSPKEVFDMVSRKEWGTLPLIESDGLLEATRILLRRQADVAEY